MPKSMPEQVLQAITVAVPAGPDGMTTQQIADRLLEPVPMRTLQYRLRHLVECGRLERHGEGRWVRYRQPTPMNASGGSGAGLVSSLPASVWNPEDDPAKYDDMLSPKGAALLRFLRQRPATRRGTGVRRRLLDAYRADESSYLNRRERARLAKLGALAPIPYGPSGYGQRIAGLLELDLAWNSARLAGSRLAELEVRRLLKFGRAPDGCDPADIQAVLNQRDALRFLLATPGEIDLDRVTLCNLHALLAHNLLADQSAGGRLRSVDCRGHDPGTRSADAPDESVESAFQQMTAKARMISDPFEQALFVFLQLPCLAPFEGFNEEVARLAVNVPLVRNGLTPLSFVDVPGELYNEGLRGVVERGRVDLMKDVFLWAYERSVLRYTGGHPARHAPDPFRLEHDTELRSVIAEVVRHRVSRHGVTAYVQAWTRERIADDVRDRFLRIVDAELRGLHECNFARFFIAPRDFRAWQDVWSDNGRAAG